MLTLQCAQLITAVWVAGFCKQQLWPLFHYLLPLSPLSSGRFQAELWQAYIKANKVLPRAQLPSSLSFAEVLRHPSLLLQDREPCCQWLRASCALRPLASCGAWRKAAACKHSAAAA